jgi:integrase
MELVKPGNPKWAGVYQRVDAKGLTTFYYKIKTFVKVGRLDQGFSAMLALRKRNEALTDEAKPGNFPKPKSAEPTLTEAWAQFEGHIIANCKNIKTPQYNWKNHLSTMAWANRPIDQITPAMVAEGKKVWAGKVALPTVLQIMLLLSRIYYHMEQYHGYTGPRPLKKGMLPKVNRKRLRMLSIPEAEALIDHLKRNHRQTYWQACFARYAGLRLGEILKLRPVDIDLRAKLISVMDTKDVRDKSKYRQVPIFPRMEEVIRDMQAVLPRKPTEVYFQTYLHLQYNKAVKALHFNDGLDSKDQVHKVGFHTLRHTFASQLLESGATVKEVQTLLGHKDIVSTNVYLHASDAGLRKAVDNLSAAIDKAVENKPALRVIEGGAV